MYKRDTGILFHHFPFDNVVLQAQSSELYDETHNYLHSGSSHYPLCKYASLFFTVLVLQGIFADHLLM